MNLTVAVKIMGGFAIIALLLIVTSINSFLSLSTIQDATTKQSELAIPTLQGSNLLANGLSTMGNLSLTGYYQSEHQALQQNKDNFDNTRASFDKDMKVLKSVVSKEQALSSNLNKVDTVYSALVTDMEQVFSSRKTSITQTQLLSETIESFEEKADDTATMLLDLADHDEAEGKLSSVIAEGERLESKLMNVVTAAIDYSDENDPQSSNLVKSELNTAMSDAEASLSYILNELNALGYSDIAGEVSSSFAEIQSILTSGNTLFSIKATQLDAFALATSKLNASKAGIEEVNQLLAKQVDLANQTTVTTTEAIDSSVSGGKTMTLLIALVSIATAVGITWFTVTSITRPLSKVNEMLNVVASGDLSRKLDESGKDEFAQLSKNCNLLIDSLRNLIQGIVSRSTQLAAAAEQTSAVTAQSTTAIEEQRNQVEQAASATTEMSSTSQSVLSSANDALGEIKQADDEAERVKGISTRNRETIELLANEVESASQVINKLQQDSASIGGILDVIRGIAEQTNLLALNAAIEAARAGEQGRGFAVVADEVRTLASRTQESTQEIQNMIEVLQSGAEKAVAVMATGKTQAANCVHQSEEADKALDTITHAVHEAFDRSEQIASAAGEQSAVAHEISENLESIVAIAEQTTAGSQQTAASSSEVARLSEELQQSVQEFKI